MTNVLRAERTSKPVRKEYFASVICFFASPQISVYTGVYWYNMVVRGKVGTGEKKGEKTEKKNKQKDARKRKKMSQTLNLNFAASPSAFFSFL